MPDDWTSPLDRLAQFAPFDLLSPEESAALADAIERVSVETGTVIFEEGTPLDGLYVIETGSVEIRTRDDDVVSHRGPGDVMGDRGLLRDGRAMLTACAIEATTLLLVDGARFRNLVGRVPEIRRWFGRAVPAEPARDDGPYAAGLTALQVSSLMLRNPVTCAAETSVTEVARTMRDRGISSVLVTQNDGLAGIVTVHDLANKVLAEGLGGDRPASDVMTPGPRTIGPDATGLDALIEMAAHRISHLPVTDRRGRLIGMIGKTDLFRQQASTASHMVADLVAADSSAEMAEIMGRLPDLLTHLVAAGARPHAICRRITDLTDAVTRRLLVLAEAALGPPPAAYLWAACGSQGRREQSGISDQDNCLILDDSVGEEHDEYFTDLARFVADGLNEAGFVYCPGDMMATNPRWRQPRRVWRRYFANWIAEPDNEAQMLASVMFDLRPIAGDAELFRNLQHETLELARRNSIFHTHMAVNSLKHTPPLSLFRGFALIRSGEHKDTVDLKTAGVVPIIDLGRLYALSGAVSEINTRERLMAAGRDGVISETGARDLIDAYDLISEFRLRHQAACIAQGRRPDNFLRPGELSELDRNHLRDAFLVVKTMQSAVGQSRIGIV
ncbi:MAG: CBS domain-containing protein [Boseongicola sp. SB0676_bin_33]|uniref:CBS domain-containing protein n=1 Tax=Boseongicola sp. SB0664_bin_43 TaxID=2604844 RepID=A0A6B0XZH0_9RHOB|nr:CBS domain-containing protein [Boseongicola sp. SB0664_bin_43]MYF88369.1 CBS domain-containing protein [Boseongicola sp. SB0676_bin_33]